MYMLSYGEVVENDPQVVRSSERQAFDIVIELLEDVASKGPESPERRLALTRVMELWQFLIDDLIHPDNALPDELRGLLISIGSWILQETRRVQYGEVEDISGIISVNKLIRDGLK
ncbi:flagellar biosynthesis regulator FlaF [Pseudochelatococcus contaminans]|uniref:Flagellar protein FlaF n=1 Tax=Pseudochelatococcus contaminans TaxID=1538103 RepID=A0A7W6EE79_9HYPH|nr:flagellar biosynthesis regulator FlaF [Pseudochelatococcus contaminans]MBB3808010.1 flagellar protein FlaF [Pseudochelatococcus contaminans]